MPSDARGHILGRCSTLPTGALLRDDDDRVVDGQTIGEAVTPDRDEDGQGRR